MGMDHIPLKQEEILDGQPVLSDINPATNTKSVDNPNTGETLDETIARMWSVINNKLTRVVNSVNGRTGVIVLTSEDVGLGNVDNVSYAEIKQWIRDTIEVEFANRALKLYDSYADVEAVCLSGDRSYGGAPFYCEWNNDNDKRSVIGYYEWDSANSQLVAHRKFINVVGSTDYSIFYDNNTGFIKVQIHPDEKALKLVEGTSYADSGLRIDESKLRGNTYFVDCLYGSGSQVGGLHDATSLLSLYAGNDAEVVSFYIDDQESTSNPSLTSHINNDWPGKLVKGDIIITNFLYRDVDESLVARVDTSLFGQQPAIGIVTVAPDESLNITTYEIRFYTIKTFIGNQYGFGLHYYNTHSENSSDVSTGQLGIFMQQSSRRFGSGVDAPYENMSGLDAYYAGKPGAGDPSTDRSSNLGIPSFITPWGPSGVNANKNGIRIAADTSLATFASATVAPARDTFVDSAGHLRYFGSARVRNWVSPSFMDQLGRIREDTPEQRMAIQNPANGYATNKSGITINLYKMVTPVEGNGWDEYTYKFSDISGLKFVAPPAAFGTAPSESALDPKNIGMPDGRDTDGVLLTEAERAYYWTSGGISVNLGKYLEIRPRVTEKADDYNDGGKVQVRLGPGLTEQVDFVLTTEEPANFTRLDVYSKYYYLDPDDGLFKPLEYQYFYDPSEPEQWESKYFDYYVHIYTHVSGASAPTWEPDKYYSKGTGLYEYNLTTEQPANWSTAYQSYYIRTEDLEPVARVYDGNIPEWRNGEFYYRSAYTWELAGFRYVDIYERRAYNRITIKTDPDTLGFNEEGDLTVVGGVGGRNLRYVDYRGCFFDTVPNRPIDDVVVLGSGLKITGGNIPLDMNLGIETKRAYVADTLDNSGVGVVLEYYIDHPVGDTPPTTATFQNIVTTRAAISSSITGANSKSTIDSIGDELYDEATWVGDLVQMDEVKLYLTENEDCLKDRIEDLFISIDGYPSEKDAWFANIIDYFDITPPAAGTDVKTYLISQIPTLKIYDTSKQYQYMLDWLFSLKFQNE